MKQFLKYQKIISGKLLRPVSGNSQCRDHVSKIRPQEAWDNYDEAFSDIGTFEDQEAAETEHDVLDDKVGDLLSRVEEFLEPDVQRQETPESEAGNGVVKYDARATAQNTSIESKIAIMERELDRDDATGQDILKYEQENVCY